MAGPDRSVTPRGFVNYGEFTGSCGAKVTVRESSAASAPHVWLFVEGGATAAPRGCPGFPPEGRRNYGSAHLTVEQARRVRDALGAFIAGRGGS